MHALLQVRNLLQTNNCNVKISLSLKLSNQLSTLYRAPYGGQPGTHEQHQACKQACRDVSVDRAHGGPIMGLPFDQDRDWKTYIE